MTATRSTREERLYKKYKRGRANDVCPFCNIVSGDPQYVEETPSLKVIRNLLPYSLWDGQGVLDHLLVVPKQHTDNLKTIQAEAAAEYLSLMVKYEDQGYNMYARAPVSTVKSVPHQHTHLIKLDGRERRFLFLVRKPLYLRVSSK